MHIVCALPVHELKLLQMLNQFPVENAQVQQDFFQIASQSISDKRNYTGIYSIQVPKC